MTITAPALEDGQPLWLFGYGSLLFKPPLHHLPISSNFVRFNGYINGYARRFWQSSYDNRGTPEQKGRVVTIIPAVDIAKNDSFHDDIIKFELSHIPYADVKQTIQNEEILKKELKVGGCIYYIPAGNAKEANDYLDLREKDGYVTQIIEFNVTSNKDHPAFNDLERNENGEPIVKCIVYVGTTENESFVGPENIQNTADVIRVCSGDSGPNDEYLLELWKELKEIKNSCSYIDALVELVKNA